MKKLFVLVLSLVSVISLAACSGGEFGASDYFKKGDVVSTVEYDGGTLSTDFQIDISRSNYESNVFEYYYYISSAIIILDITSDHYVFQKIASVPYKLDKDLEKVYYNIFTIKVEEVEDEEEGNFDYDKVVKVLNDAYDEVLNKLKTVEECYVVNTYLIPKTSIEVISTTDEDTRIFNKVKLNYTDLKVPVIPVL